MKTEWCDDCGLVYVEQNMKIWLLRGLLQVAVMRQHFPYIKTTFTTLTLISPSINISFKGICIEHMHTCVCEYACMCGLNSV